MGRQNRPRNGGQLAAPTRQDEQRSAELAKLKEQKKSFLKTISKSEHLIVFTGNGNVNYFGFGGNISQMLLFMVEQVYGWDGMNPVFQNVLKNLLERQQSSPEMTDEVDEILDELEKENEINDNAGIVGKDDAGSSVDDSFDAPSDDEEPNKEDEAESLRKRLAVLEGKGSQEKDKTKAKTGRQRKK